MEPSGCLTDAGGYVATNSRSAPFPNRVSHRPHLCILERRDEAMQLVAGTSPRPLRRRSSVPARAVTKLESPLPPTNCPQTVSPILRRAVQQGSTATPATEPGSMPSDDEAI